MLDTTAHFDRVYEAHASAFGCDADAELVSALEGLPGGMVVDLGGGEGRNSLQLARMGLQVEVVDTSETALRRLLSDAQSERLRLTAVCVDIAAYVPPPGVTAAVAALFFHLPARWRSLEIARRVGSALRRGGLFYLSLPGFDDERVAFAGGLLEAAGCGSHRITNHVVTRRERPRLPVPRRNETRALGFKL